MIGPPRRGDPPKVGEPPRGLARSGFARKAQGRGGRRAVDRQRIGVERIGRQSRHDLLRRAVDRSAADHLDDDLRQIALLVLGFGRLTLGAIRTGLVGHRAEREVQIARCVQRRREQCPRLILILCPLHGLRLDITDLGITRTLMNVGARKSVFQHGVPFRDVAAAIVQHGSQLIAVKVVQPFGQPVERLEINRSGRFRCTEFRHGLNRDARMQARIRIVSSRTAVATDVVCRIKFQ